MDKMEEMDLEEILFKNCNAYMLHYFNEAEYRKLLVLNAMKDACKQVLELAAENVEIIYQNSPELGSYDVIVDKQSILDTINQVK